MTQSIVLVASILSSLIAAGFSLTCTKCEGTAEACFGLTVRCPSLDDVCISMYSVTTYDDLPGPAAFVRDCGKRSLCSKFLSVSSQSFKTRSAVTCCSSDGCTPSQPSLPPESSKKNGVTCKMCYEKTNKACQSNVFMDCLGNETKCISQINTVEGKTGTALRGCASKDVCDLSQETTTGQVNAKIYTTCTDGGHTFYCNWMLLLMSLSLLLKFT